MRLRVGLVQLGVSPSAEAGRALDEIAAVVQEGADRGAGLVVLPQDAGSLEPIRGGSPPSIGTPTWEERLATLARAARGAGVYVAAGLERPEPMVGVPDAAVCVLFDPAGVLAAMVPGPRNRADRDRMPPSLPSQVVDTALGRLGLLRGEDLADPVPARRLAEAGVCALIVPSALGARDRVAAAERQAAVDRPRARARENGVVVCVADWSGKVGRRRLLGTTAVYGPGGVRLAAVAPGRDGLTLADLDLPTPLLRRSRGARLPPTPPRLPRSPRRTLVLAVAQGSDHGTWTPAARPLSAHLLVAPLLPRGDHPLPCLARVAGGRARAMVAGRATREVVRGERFVASQRVVDGGATRVGVLFGDEVTAPEPARLLAAAGAQVLVLFAEMLDPEDARFWARVRARENAVAAVVSGRPQGTLVAPDGRIVAEGALRRSAVVSGRVTVGGTRVRVAAQAHA